MNSTKNDLPIPFCLESLLALLKLRSPSVRSAAMTALQNTFISSQFLPDAIAGQDADEMRKLAAFCGRTCLHVKHILDI